MTKVKTIEFHSASVRRIFVLSMKYYTFCHWPTTEPTDSDIQSYLRQVTIKAMMRMRSSAPPAGDTTTAISL